MKKNFFIVFLFLMMCVTFITPTSAIVYAQSANLNSVDLEKTIEDLINWKKAEVGSSPSENLINGEFLKLAGSTSGDWFPIGLGRYNYSDNSRGYLATITDNVNERYKTKGKLHSAKATEWHRISLAIIAMGGNPLSFGECEGAPINLIADGTYDRGLTASPGRQGINGWIWALIALDAQRYKVPENAFQQRQDFIVEILKAQLSDGGMALSGGISDPDITAMAIQALAPYYNSELTYNYTSTKIKGEDGNYIKVQKKVKTVIDEGLNFLSSVQTDDGDFMSWGTQNLESTCQVFVALNSLGIDALSDIRFIKKGKTLLDGIMRYRKNNGGFIHSFSYDPENPNSNPNEANTMASEQALYTLVSLWRYNNGMRVLYDMRTEFTAVEKTAIDSTILAISQLDDSSNELDVKNALQRYEAITPLNRNYINNYWKLSGYVNKFDLASLLPKEELIFSGSTSDGQEVITEFTDTERQVTDDLPDIEKLDTSYLSVVTELRYAILNCVNEFEDKSYYKMIIEKAYNQVILIQNEIKAINLEIADKLQPFDKIGLSDKKTIYGLVERYEKLSAYDKKGITHYEDLLKSKTQVDNLTTALIVGLSIGAVAVVLAVFVILNIKKRKRAKRAIEMSESEE